MMHNKTKRINDAKKHKRRKKFVRRRRGKDTRMKLRLKEKE